MKRLQISLLAVVAIGGTSHAAHVSTADSTVLADSLERVETLREFTVEGRSQRVIKNGVEYIPDKKVKRAAYNAASLLMHMQIPQLNVSPADMSIKTLSGGSVSVFIDYRKASGEDLQSLRPQDVLRVEVLRYPDDPRFDGETEVVNFIMVKYDWGGYSKLMANGTTLNNDNGSVSAYSKFVYKNLTFDASAGGTMSHADKEDTYTSTTYRDITFRGKHYDELTRIQSSADDSYLNLNNSQWATLRADLRLGQNFLRHSLRFSRSGNPRSYSGMTVGYSDASITSSHSVSRNNGQSIMPGVSGYYYFVLPKNNTISLSWDFGYSSNRRNSLYTLDGFNPIVNNNKEDVYSPTATLNYTRRFSHNNSFTTSLMSFNSIYNTDYEGSYNQRQRLLSSENMLFLEYRQNWQSGLSLYSRLGVSYVAGRVNGENSLNQWNPRLGLDLQYRINSKNSAEIEFWWGNSHPHPSTANSAIVQRDEISWSEGNPDLRNTIFITTKAHYTYMPNNKFSLYAELGYIGNPDKQAVEYYTKPGYDGIISKTINSGSAHEYSALVQGRLRLLGNSLYLSAYGGAFSTVLTGIDSQTLNCLKANVQAQYFYKNFVFNLYYNTPQKSLGAWSEGIRRSYGSTYGLYAGYNTGEFNVALQFHNWFGGHDYSEAYLNNPRLLFYARQWNASLARSVSLTLTYTFGYGKKVNHNDELQGGASQSNSAILK